MAKHNVWMSVSDLMTGLMVIFLFVAVAYMIQVQDNQLEIEKYIKTKEKLYTRLNDEFRKDTANWKMVIDNDLTVKFKEPDVLFAQGSGEIQPLFCDILDNFIPRYLKILLTTDTILRKHIREIRIEGHTDTLRMVKYGKDSYLSNVLLSQERAYNVLKYIREMPSFEKYTPEERKLLDYWFTANGLSYGKALDIDGNYAAISGSIIDQAKSRRVEFRIVTDEEILKKINQ